MEECLPYLNMTAQDHSRGHQGEVYIFSLAKPRSVIGLNKFCRRRAELE